MKRFFVGVGIILALVAVFFALKSVLPLTTSSTATSTAGTVQAFALVVQKGKVVSGTGDITVHQGDTVRLMVTNDADNEVHIHGYNLMVDLEAGKPGTITFVANASGRFPFELEKTKQELGAISVLPR